MADGKLKLYRGFALGEWRVTPLKGQIESPDGVKLHVAPKAMDVLVCLASKSGEVVERATIFTDVWGEPPWSDEALTHCIGELRQAFGETADDPEFFQTIPRRGYRLLGEVSSGSEESSTNPGTEDDPPDGWLGRQLGDLRKRKVFQTVIGYPVLAWLLVQIVDVLWEYLLQPLGAPAWLVPSFVVLLALGFPIAVFLAWAVDLTPEGVRLTETEKESKPLFGMTILGVGSVALTVVALFLYFNAYEPPAPQTAPSTEHIVTPVPESIAVLRFLNISGNPAVAYLSDGLTEELIHELTNLKSLKVAARTSVWPLSRSELSVQDIIRRLGVEKILEGSIRSEGDQIRVTAQLIDGDGFHLWSQTYDREMADMLEVQKEIAAQVVNELDVLLTDDHQARLKTRPTFSSDAYDQYLRGRQALREPGTAENIQAAQGHFNAAIEADSRFPLAYAGLCETHLANYRLTRDTDVFSAAEIACHRALTLDGGLAEVYTALGNLYRHSGQYEKAEQEYVTALKINPMLEEANYGLGRAYQSQGRLPQAEETLLRSIELEPGYWGTYMGFGNFLHRQGRYEESVPYYEKVTELAPNYAGGFINLGSSLHWLGRWDEAEVAWLRSLELESDALGYQNMGTLYYYQHRFEASIEMHEQATLAAPADHRGWGKLAAAQRYVSGRAAASQESYRKAIELVRKQLDVNPDEPEDLSYLSVYLTNSGDHAGARVAIERSLAIAPENPSAHYFAAILEMNSGNDEKALSALEKAVRFGYSYKLLEADPEFSSLKDRSAEFRALLSKK